jgi:hypothetical protein
MLMIGRIKELSFVGREFGKGHVVRKLDIAPDLWFFAANHDVPAAIRSAQDEHEICPA